jgi:hypothetical protein
MMREPIEAEQHHLLAMIEAAQRNGRSEHEIIAIVDRYFSTEVSDELGLRREAGLLRRLLGRKRAA